MKKLVLLSNVSNNNRALVRKVKELIGNDDFKLAYIPSQTDKEKRYFEKAKPELKGMGAADFFHFDVDEEYKESQLDEFKNCDGIFLSGGNTYSFLKNLQEKNINTYIKEMVQEDKLLIGVSAGSMIMSKTIKIAAFHDDNEVGLKQLNGLGLVDFEFMPHWQRLENHLERVLKYSLMQEESIFACRDGDGIIIHGDKIEFYGEINEIRYGTIS